MGNQVSQLHIPETIEYNVVYLLLKLFIGVPKNKIFLQLKIQLSNLLNNRIYKGHSNTKEGTSISYSKIYLVVIPSLLIPHRINVTILSRK